MNTLKLLSWNVEWMNDLFDGDGNFRPSDAKLQHAPDTTVETKRQQLAGVISEIAPEVIVIIEGPNTNEELQLFFDADIEGEWKTHLQRTKGSSQCIGIALKKNSAVLATTKPIEIFDTAEIDAFKDFELKNEQDGIIEKYRFERLPLYVQLNLADGKPCRILGLHLKSKGIFDAYEWSKWWNMADANRKKILAQCSRIRQQFLDKYLEDAATKEIPLIVCGDINDGPGLDASEKRLLGSGIERLMGNVWLPKYCCGNALFDSLSTADKQSLNFEKIYTTTFKDPIFNNVWHKEWIDHILYTTNVNNWTSNGKVHLELSDGSKIWEKYKHASDHIPISVDINL